MQARRKKESVTARSGERGVTEFERAYETDSHTHTHTYIHSTCTYMRIYIYTFSLVMVICHFNDHHSSMRSVQSLTLRRVGRSFFFSNYCVKVGRNPSPSSMPSPRCPFPSSTLLLVVHGGGGEGMGGDELSGCGN
jgi:hypothetical protein